MTLIQVHVSELKWKLKTDSHILEYLIMNDTT